VRPRRRPRRPLRGLGLAVVLLSGGCRFAVVGDSVVSISRTEIGQEGGEALAHGGVDIVTGRPAIRELAEHPHEPLVISLGLMDVSDFATPAEVAHRIRSVLRDDVAHVDCVIWVDLKLTSNVHHQWPRRAMAFNRMLTEVADEFHRPVARWSLESSGHPEWFQPDGVHPNRLGQRQFAAFVADQVESRC
jgi:hypothetical protein